MIKEVKITTVRETGPFNESCQRPETVCQMWNESVAKAEWYDNERECMIVFCLDRKNRVKSWNMISIGTVDTCLIHPREAFRAACVASSASIIIAHHHPSGDPTPSAEDVRVTKQLVASGQVLGIPVLDHVVMGDASVGPSFVGYISLRDKGYLSFTP